MRISDWSSDVCSSDLADEGAFLDKRQRPFRGLAFLRVCVGRHAACSSERMCWYWAALTGITDSRLPRRISAKSPSFSARSEEHTSELQSLMRISYAVFCLKIKTKHHFLYNTN